MKKLINKTLKTAPSFPVKPPTPLPPAAAPRPKKHGPTPLVVASAGTLLAGCLASAAWLSAKHFYPAPAPRPATSRYTAGGYGGYVGSAANGESTENSPKPTGAGTGAKSEAALPTKSPVSSPVSSVPVDLALPVRAAYAKGDYAQAEKEAARVVRAAYALPKTDPKQPAALKEAAKARYLQAFASARRHDLSAAREHFAELQTEAGALPDKGKIARTVLQAGAAPEPTLLESAAYQHAVCTSALGDKAGAEREFMAFMKDYPDSPLVQASIKRIARFHGGDIPKDAEAAWQNAMKTAQAHDKEAQKQMSLCAPQCLAELIQRQGGTDKTDKAASIADLTREMKTSERGTSLADLCQTAKRHGFSKAHGVALTDAGLQKQKLPVVALIAPDGKSGFASGHFVLVEQVSKDGAVKVWSPTGSSGSQTNQTRQTLRADLQGRARATKPQAGMHTYPAAQWKQMWNGIALVTQ